MAALREQLADAPPRGATLAAEVGAALDAGRVPVVVPAAVASAALRRRGGQDRDARERQQWLTDQLGFTYPQVPADGWPAVTATQAAVELVVLEDGGRAPVELGDVGDLAVRRVALEPGQLAVHPHSPRPTWALVAGFDLVALACWALLWSYDFRPLVCALLAVVLAATLAGVRGFSPLAPRRSVGVRSWPREHALAAGGAAATAAVSFAVGLLAIDGLSARDSLVVIVPMVAAGAWIGGGDALAVMWHQSRRRRVVVDVGSTRVLADAPQPATPMDLPQEPPTVPMAAMPPDP
jgi:hypothetical protein